MRVEWSRSLIQRPEVEWPEEESFSQFVMRQVEDQADPDAAMGALRRRTERELQRRRTNELRPTERWIRQD